jgi:threonine/homoserine/homoserine lactone efflux protein
LFKMRRFFGDWNGFENPSGRGCEESGCMLIYLSQGLLLGFSAAAQPGPFQAYLLAQTIRGGWRRSIWAAFAPLLSDGPIILLVLLVLTRTPDWFLNLMRLFGGLFLLYLAWGAYQTFLRPPDVSAAPAGARQGVVQAAVMNGLSPNPYIFWGTISGPILLAAWRQSPAWGSSFVVGFYGALIGGFMAFVALFAIAKNLDPRLSRVLSAFSAVALLLFGLYQLVNGGRGLLALVLGSP